MNICKALSTAAATNGPKKVVESQIVGDQRVTWFENISSFGCDSEMKFVPNDYTNINTNPKRPSQRLIWP